VSQTFTFIQNQGNYDAINGKTTRKIEFEPIDCNGETIELEPLEREYTYFTTLLRDPTLTDIAWTNEMLESQWVLPVVGSLKHDEPIEERTSVYEDLLTFNA